MAGLKAMNKEIEKGRVGDSFGDFLKEQGTYKETTEQAVKRVIAHQLATAMKPVKTPKRGEQL